MGNATISDQDRDRLFRPLQLPCGVILKNRIAKSAMSDSLGDGRGNPTDEQIRLYGRWARGGPAVSIIGEVQGNPRFAEKPGNLVLCPDSDLARFKQLAEEGSANGTLLWLQLGHAGAMAHPPISNPKGPSAIDIPGLACTALTKEEIRDLPSEFAATAKLAGTLGFGGVEIHAAHGFLIGANLVYAYAVNCGSRYALQELTRIHPDDGAEEDGTLVLSPLAQSRRQSSHEVGD